MSDIRKSYHYLDKDVSKCIKGICALVIVLHHANQRTLVLAGSYIGELFDIIGFLAVSMFFFFSGYGLMISYESKGDSYTKSFLKKRVLPIYLIYLFLTVLYSVVKLLIGEAIGFADVIKGVFLVDTIVTYGWYLKAIILFYIVFYLTFRLCKTLKMRVGIIAIFLLLYMLYYHVTDAAPATYISSLSFLLGIVWCIYREQIDKMLEKRRVFFSLFLGLVAVFCVILATSMLISTKNIRWPLRIVASPMFVVILLVFTSLIVKNHAVVLINGFTKLLGKISLEIYVLQGLFFDALRSDLINIENAYVYIVLVFVCTFSLAPLLMLLDNYIYKLCRK